MEPSSSYDKQPDLALIVRTDALTSIRYVSNALIATTEDFKSPKIRIIAYTQSHVTNVLK